MGIDVEIWARRAEPFTDDEVVALSDALRAYRNVTYDGFNIKRPDPRYHDDEDDAGGRTIEVNVGGWRFYGPGYERGPWPDIKDVCDWLTVQLGEQGEVRYGGDGSFGFDELMPWLAQRDDIEAHWQWYGHLPYRLNIGGCDCDHCVTLTWTPMKDDS